MGGAMTRSRCRSLAFPLAGAAAGNGPSGSRMRRHRWLEEARMPRRGELETRQRPWNAFLAPSYQPLCSSPRSICGFFGGCRKILGVSERGRTFFGSAISPQANAKPRAGRLFLAPPSGRTDFFGGDAKKVGRGLGLGAATERQSMFCVAAAALVPRSWRLPLFWRRHQKSPFLAPQKSQKSPPEGGPFGSLWAGDRQVSRFFAPRCAV